MNIYQQAPPYAIQVELTEGCNLACSFCGINGIRAKPGQVYKYMTEETLVSLVTQIRDLGWNPRLEFAMHGEPTMHPNYISMVQRVYEIHPKLHVMMTTNGGGIVRGDIEGNIKGLFRAGLNILALDDYDGIKIIGKIRPHLDLVCDDLGIKWYEYPRDPDGNPHRRGGNPFVSIIEDISKVHAGTHSRLNNHCGAAGPLDESMATKRCAKPFREMSVRWDGNVAICCEDWRGQYKCGNILDGLLKTWLSEEFEAARRKLILGERDFGSCQGCNARSYRTGLLPDKYGQDSLDPPDEESNLVLSRAFAGPAYTNRVARPWEVEANDDTTREERARGVQDRDGVPAT